MSSECRTCPRVSIIGLEAATGKAVLREHEILEITRGGLCVHVLRREPPGARVRLQIAFLETDESVTVDGKIVWATYTRPYEVGIRFLGVDYATAAILARHLDPE